MKKIELTEEEIQEVRDYLDENGYIDLEETLPIGIHMDLDAFVNELLEVKQHIIKNNPNLIEDTMFVAYDLDDPTDICPIPIYKVCYSVQGSSEELFKERCELILEVKKNRYESYLGLKKEFGEGK